MLDPLLEEMVTLYASGAMPSDEREKFELVLEFHAEMRALAAQLNEVAAAVTLGSLGATRHQPGAALKGRILEALDRRIREKQDGFVVTDADGLVQWVNPAFSDLCGYSLDEVRGRKLGPLLQGPATDRVAAERMRSAVHAHRPCTEELVNYHKNGSPYWVRIEISPVVDPEGRARWLVGREIELTERAIAA